jgi:hypothetical protein
MLCNVSITNSNVVSGCKDEQIKAHAIAEDVHTQFKL